jgi:DNA repair exonuclease SbcCD ATPase subunit
MSAQAELQQWLDAAEAENELLRAKVDALEAGAGEVEGLRARVAELEKTPASSGPASELQQWLDAAEAENEKLKGRLAELEKAPPSSGPASELQQWLDAAEAENEKLKGRLAELEKAPPSSGPASELQQWLDAAEAENETLMARVAELETSPAAGAGEAEHLKAQLVAAEAKSEGLRREVAELQCIVAASEAPSASTLVRPAPTSSTSDAKVKELQDWLDAAEAENARLRDELAQAKPDVVGSGNAESEYLRERLAESEAALHAMKGLNQRFAEQIEASTRRDVERLQKELSEAKASNQPARVRQLEAAVTEAHEAIATLTAERQAAIDQVRRFAGADDAQLAAVKSGLEQKVAEKDKRLSELEAERLGMEEDLAGFRQRISAWERRDAELQSQVDELQKRAAAAEASLFEVKRALETTEAREATKDARIAELERTATEADAWQKASEVEAEGLRKQLEALQLEKALRGSEGETSTNPPPPPAEALTKDDESAVVRALTLEKLLERERQTSAALRRFADASERSLAKATDDLELALARIKDLKGRLGAADTDAGEALDRLFDSQQELASLRAELSRALSATGGAPEPGDELLVDDAEVRATVDGPLSAVDQLGAAQAQATKEATDALAAEHRAKEALLSDLQWLKGEFEKLSHVREDLRARIAAMVKRELERKSQLARLLATLRQNEVSAAARLSAVRRLQAAVELAQRMAVKVQTVYFQKQVGSLSKQLEKERKAWAAEAVQLKRRAVRAA